VVNRARKANTKQETNRRNAIVKVNMNDKEYSTTQKVFCFIRFLLSLLETLQNKYRLGIEK
jgi:hypothetical protein